MIVEGTWDIIDQEYFHCIARSPNPRGLSMDPDMVRGGWWASKGLRKPEHWSKCPGYIAHT